MLLLVSAALSRPSRSVKWLLCSVLRSLDHLKKHMPEFVMHGWVTLTLTAPSKLHITWQPTIKHAAGKVCRKQRFSAFFTTLPLRPTFAESLTSSPNAGCPIASEESHSHTRYPPDVREREWEWDRGKLGERKKEGEQARVKRKGVSKGDSSDLNSSQKHKFFPFFSYFLLFFPPPPKCCRSFPGLM